MFGDMLDWIPYDNRQTIKNDTFAEKKRKLSGVHLREQAHCHTHGGKCQIYQNVDLDFSGLPCPDFSKANRKRKFQEGPSGPVPCPFLRVPQKLELATIEELPFIIEPLLLFSYMQILWPSNQCGLTILTKHN